MARFRYTGPLTGVTLIAPDGATSEHMLHPGGAVELPTDHPHVATLVALKRLTPDPAPDSGAPDEAPSPAAALSAALPSRRPRRTISGGAASLSSAADIPDEGTIE